MRCAADTNFLINLATTKELALDALAVVQERVPHFDRLVTETAGVLLISDDSHLHGINRDQLARSLRPFGLEAPAIVTTGQIVRLFYR